VNKSIYLTTFAKNNCDYLPLESRMRVTKFDLTWWSLVNCTHSNSFDSKSIFASTIVAFMAYTFSFVFKCRLFVSPRCIVGEQRLLLLDEVFPPPSHLFVSYNRSQCKTSLNWVITFELKQHWTWNKNHKCQQFQNVDKLGLHYTWTRWTNLQTTPLSLLFQIE